MHVLRYYYVTDRLRHRVPLRDVTRSCDLYLSTSQNDSAALRRATSMLFTSKFAYQLKIGLPTLVNCLCREYTVCPV